jgi:hypothetical protein
MALTEQTRAPNTNEDTAYRCGESYKECVVIPAPSPELFTNKHYSPSFDEEQFQDLVRQSNYIFRQLEF